MALSWFFFTGISILLKIRLKPKIRQTPFSTNFVVISKFVATISLSRTYGHDYAEYRNPFLKNFQRHPPFAQLITVESR